MKKDELTPEELQILEQRRQRQEKLKECSDKVAVILEEYKAQLVIDPQSPIGNPRIVINL